MKKEKGQVSIETLLLAGIIIMLSITIFGYYTRIMNPTIALEIIEIETLKQIDVSDKQYFILEIGNKAENGCEYGNSSSVICFCIMLKPGSSSVDDILDTDKITDAVISSTSYAPGTVSITQNSLAYCS